LQKLENYREIDYNKLRALAEKLSNLNSKTRAFSRHKNLKYPRRDPALST